MNNMNIAENMKTIQDIRRKLNNGDITYDEAKELAKPIVDNVNLRAKELAEKYGQHYSPISLASML